MSGTADVARSHVAGWLLGTMSAPEHPCFLRAGAEREALERRRRDKAEALGEEPPATSAGCCTIRVRMPGGSNVARRFLESEPVAVLYDWVDSLDHGECCCSLLCLALESAGLLRGGLRLRRGWCQPAAWPPCLQTTWTTIWCRPSLARPSLAATADRRRCETPD